jgi:hypothetical protein
MKSVLPISTLLLAAILLTPATGYTIQVQNPNNYSISVGPHANFSIGSGTPAHELNYTEAAAPCAVQPAVIVTKTPYSFTTLGSVSYSISTPTTQGVEALGPQTVPNVAKLGSMNQVQQVAQTAPTTQAATAVAETPAAATPAAAPAAVPATYSISGTVFGDAEGNGAKEVGLAGWTVDLTGAAQKSVTTAADGSYAFANLAAGSYTVTAVVPSGWKAVSPASGSYSISVTKANVTGKDFGNQMITVPEGNVTAPAANVTAPA